MHSPSEYELYLSHETKRYGFNDSAENDFSAWLVLEKETYRWIFTLDRKMRFHLKDAVVSKKTLARIEKIPTIRFLRYRDISPVLKKAISDIAAEFALLNEDLKQSNMWKRPCLLSKVGLDRWKKAIQLVDECVRITPDPAWRENWIKERELSYHTKQEAENSVSD